MGRNDFRGKAEFPQGFSGHDAGRNLGQGFADGLADEGDRAGCPGVHLEQIDGAFLNGELNVHEAADAQFPRESEGGGADLVDDFGGKGVAGDDAGAIAGMDTGLFDMLHDGTNDSIFPIGNAVDIHLRGILQEAVEQNGTAGGHLRALVHVVADFFLGVDDPHGSAAQNERGPEQKGKTDPLGDGDRLVGVVGRAIRRLAKAKLIEEGGEELAVFSPFNGFHRGPEDTESGGLKF